MNCRILQGDVFDMLPTIAPGSVDCAVTSPPYWALRSYLPDDHPLKEFELGQEKSPAEYVARMVEVFRLVRTCMADHATLWLNVGDTYSGSGRTGGMDGKQATNDASAFGGPRARAAPDGNLCLIPQRLMIALQDDGWVVRKVVIWHKPSPMPDSVHGWRWERCRKKVGKCPNRSTDRYGTADDGVDSDLGNRGGAQWTDCPGCKKCQKNGGLVLSRGSWRPTSAYEPVIMLAKSMNYYADGEPVKTPPAQATVSRDQYTRILDDPDEQFAVRHDHETVCNGANLRDVWTISSEPLKEKHYAAYPSELVYRCLAAGTSAEGYCKACGAPWVRVVEAEKWSTRPNSRPVGTRGNCDSDFRALGDPQQAGQMASTRTLGWRPSCECPDPAPRPGLVLDPFAGSGRTAIVARRLQLDFVGVELNPDYAAMCKRLVKADAPLFNVVGG